ncbi:ABC transporter substrate-binding protein, partial [Raoultella ornithinolytica]|uniref:ABC transporter substrate-binding protein n=6 Tax=Pseudomonadota TaxID=1224 RepID=UPI0013DCB6CE
GIEHSQGIISVSYLKDPTDTIWANDAETKEWRSFMDKYMPDGDKTNGNHVYGYAAAQTLAQVLKQCGDDLTRENVMKQAASLK